MAGKVAFRPHCTLTSRSTVAHDDTDGSQLCKTPKHKQDAYFHGYRAGWTRRVADVRQDRLARKVLHTALVFAHFGPLWSKTSAQAADCMHSRAHLFARICCPFKGARRTRQSIALICLLAVARSENGSRQGVVHKPCHAIAEQCPESLNLDQGQLALSFRCVRAARPVRPALR